MNVNSISITVSLRSTKAPGLVLIIEGERRILPLSEQSRLFAEVRDLVLDASEQWGRE